MKNWKDYWSLKFTVYDVKHECFLTLDYDMPLDTESIQNILEASYNDEEMELRRIDKIEWQYGAPV